MFLDVFAGVAVSEFNAALAWYERLLGAAPAFLPHDTEAVWELAEHRYLYIVQQPERAGHALQMLFVDDIGAAVAEAAERGLRPVRQEEFGAGVRKVTYRDPDGNEIAFGGAPV